jgi:hypothetical protein
MMSFVLSDAAAINRYTITIPHEMGPSILTLSPFLTSICRVKRTNAIYSFPKISRDKLKRDISKLCYFDKKKDRNGDLLQFLTFKVSAP